MPKFKFRPMRIFLFKGEDFFVGQVEKACWNVGIVFSTSESSRRVA